MEAKEIESFQVACKASSPALEHAPPNIMEPWRIELHPLSLRRTNAALVHEAPSKSHPKCQSAARLHEPSVSGSGGIRIRDLLHAMQALCQNWATNPYFRLIKKTRLPFRCNLVPYQPNLKGILPVQRPQFLGATEITFCGGKTNRAIIQVWQLLFHSKIFSYDILFIWMLEIKWWIFKGKMQLFM